MFDIAILLLVLLGVLYKYFTRGHDYWQKRGIVHEKPTIFAGNLGLALLAKKPAGQIITEIYRKYQGEKVVGIYNFNKPALLIRDPELIHRIFVTDFYNFSTNEIHIEEDIDPVFGKNIFVLNGERWKRERAMITPAFTLSRVKTLFSEIDNVAKELIEYIGKHPGELHVKDLLGRYTSEVVMRFGMGVDGKGFQLDEPPFHAIGKLVFEPNFMNGIKQMLTIVAPWLGRFLRVRFVPKSVAEFFESTVKDIINHRKGRENNRNDIIQYFIDLRNKSVEVEKGTVKSDLITRELTEQDVLVHFVTFFLDGYETTSQALNNIFFELSKNKDIQDKLRNEIIETDEKCEGKLTLDLLTEMPYLSTVISEGIRKQSPIYYLGKVCTKNTEIDIGRNKPLLVEKGTIMTIPVEAIHWDPELWEDPMAFKPERFNEENKNKIKKGSYLAFGDGPRICIGMRIATAVLKVALYNVLKEFEVHRGKQTPDEFSPDPVNFFRGHKEGIFLKFEKLKI